MRVIPCPRCSAFGSAYGDPCRCPVNAPARPPIANEDPAMPETADAPYTIVAETRDAIFAIYDALNLRNGGNIPSEPRNYGRRFAVTVKGTAAGLRAIVCSTGADSTQIAPIQADPKAEYDARGAYIWPTRGAR